MQTMSIFKSPYLKCLHKVIIKLKTLPSDDKSSHITQLGINSAKCCILRFFSAKCLFGKECFRQRVFSAKCHGSILEYLNSFFFHHSKGSQSCDGLCYHVIKHQNCLFCCGVANIIVYLRCVNNLKTYV